MIQQMTVEQRQAWAERIDLEVNRRLGGDATVGDIADIMRSLGWQAPAGIPPDSETPLSRE